MFGGWGLVQETPSWLCLWTSIKFYLNEQTTNTYLWFTYRFLHYYLYLSDILCWMLEQYSICLLTILITYWIIYKHNLPVGNFIHIIVHNIIWLVIYSMSVYISIYTCIAINYNVTKQIRVLCNRRNTTRER